LHHEGRFDVIEFKSSWRMVPLAHEDREIVRASSDRVMDALLDIEAETSGYLHSAAVYLDLGRMSIGIDLTVNGDDVDAAGEDAYQAIRTALKRAGHLVADGDAPKPIAKSAKVLEPA
jgi:hypothetical protein